MAPRRPDPPQEPPRPCIVRLAFRAGARTFWSVPRTLVRLPQSLELEGRAEPPRLPDLPPEADGYSISGLHAGLEPALTAAHPEFRAFVRQRYRRSYASLQGGYEAYLGHFSAKTRSTLKRKLRKLAERSGGQIDVRSYSTPDQVETFYSHARAVSATTYQERLLRAGLPEGKSALAHMRALAARDAMRGWLLFVDDRPISYLYVPAEGDTLIYAFLGYDPAFADLSPGTVLQLEAMRELLAERRFRIFDFTEGDGQHKRQFATGSVECVDLLLLRPTLSNLALGHALELFDRAIARTKSALAAVGLHKLARTACR